MFRVDGFDDPTGLDAAELAARFVALERQRRLVDAALAAVVGEADRTGAFRHDGHASILGWCRALAGWSTAEARHAVRAARLTVDHDGFAEHYLGGRVPVRHVEDLTRVRAHPRCGHEFVDHLDGFLERIDRTSFTELHARLEDWKHLHDTDGAFTDHDHTHTHRDAHVNVWDGAVTGALRGGASDGAFLTEVLDRFTEAEFLADWEAARAVFGEHTNRTHLARTDPQRRFDALVEIFRRAVAAPADARDPVPSVTITCDVHTLDALCHTQPTLPTARDPWTPAASTTNGTPVPPGDLLAAMWWGRIRTAIVDTHHDVIALGNHRRLFTGKTRDAVMLHAHHCIWPGCTTPVSRCHADHRTEHAHGGPTTPANGAPLCPRHNRFKSTHGYRVTRHPHGGWTITRPDGTNITRPPTTHEPPSTAPPGRASPRRTRRAA